MTCGIKDISFNSNKGIFNGRMSNTATGLILGIGHEEEAERKLQEYRRALNQQIQHNMKKVEERKQVVK
jgi:hypothetical protein